jgi:hypothetical protein
MAVESQLTLLKQGAKAWNEWLRERRKDRVEVREADLHGVTLLRADLSDATLIDAELRGVDLSEVDLRRVNLSQANLIEANLTKANLMGANLRKANFYRANLSRANLRGADLHGADLRGADLHRAKLTEANLSGADLYRANLWSAILGSANFKNAIVGSTIFGSVDLSSCRGLDSIRHQRPSTIGVDTIIRSKGQIPETFLRGVGLPDEWINYIPSLVGNSIQFFSCFISYSSSDRPFAVRLHDALQSKGIRCWLDEKQLLPGHDISRELERGIYLWDKFLLCASENSLTSWWVEDEIKTALEKERALRKERGEPVRKLIPLNLDGYMFTDKWDLGVFATEIRSRVAADFRDWENSSSNFDKQVDRVIKALRADEGARELPPPSRL